MTRVRETRQGGAADGRIAGATRPATPPRGARRLLYHLLPAELREDALAELDDKFSEYVAAHPGAAWPRRWYRLQVLGALRPSLWRVSAPPPQRRDARTTKGNGPMISDWLHDVRFGLRMLAKTPAMTAVIVLTLAVGIGFNGAIFSLANTILGSDMPVPEPERVAFIQSIHRTQGQHDPRVSYPDYQDFAAAAHSFEALGAWSTVGINLGDETEAPQRLVASQVTPTMFDVLAVEPALGRRLMDADAEQGAPAVALLGYGLWQSRYAGNEGIVGQMVRVSGTPHTVIGVLPPALEQAPIPPDLWLPLERTEERTTRRDARTLRVAGRLADGIGHADATVELEQLAARLAEDHAADNRDVTAVALTFSEAYTEDSNRVITLILLAAVGLLLLIACANVANLLIARAMERGGEVGIRAALGASRWRVVRQMLIESLLLSTLGGFAAVALAVWGARALESAIMLADPPEYWDFSVQPSVYGFIAVLAVGTSLLFGLAPALHATRQRGAEVLKEGGRGGQGSGPRRLTGALVIVQLSLAVILLTSAGVMIRSTRNVHTVEWPVDPDAVVTMGITLPVADYPEREQIVAFHDELRRRVTALPGVDGYAIASTVPGQGGYTVLAGIESREAEGDEAGELLQQVIVGPGYFDLVDTRPLRGRLFMDADVYEGEMVVVVEQRLADRFWPGEDAVGKRFRWLDQEERRWLTVVGVVPDIKQTVSLGFTGDYPVVYTPYRQEPLRNTGMLVRSASPAEAVAALLRDEVERLDANLPLYDVAILRSVVNERMIGFRIVSVLFFLLGGIALFLSCIGIYAVMAFAVGRRQREIGIRVALGAQRREVLTLVVRRAAFQTTVGLVLGLLAALATTRLLGMYLYEVSPNDPATFVLTVMVLLATAVAASLVPARRAGRVDPLAALRSQ